LVFSLFARFIVSPYSISSTCPTSGKIPRRIIKRSSRRLSIWFSEQLLKLLGDVFHLINFSSAGDFFEDLKKLGCCFVRAPVKRLAVMARLLNSQLGFVLNFWRFQKRHRVAFLPPASIRGVREISVHHVAVVGVLYQALPCADMDAVFHQKWSVFTMRQPLPLAT